METSCSRILSNFREKASRALQNAVSAFDDAKDVTRMMRGEEDDLGDLNDQIELEEFAYTTKLIEIFGQPYAGDIGPGKTYPQGYVGPDLLNWAYVEGFDPASDTRTGELSRFYKINTQGLDTNSFELKAVTKTFTEFSSDVWQYTNEKNETGAYDYFLILTVTRTSLITSRAQRGVR